DFNKKEINTIDMIRVLGIDYIDNQYSIIALYGIGGPDTINGDIETIEARGNTLFEAFENLKKKNQKDLSFAYTSFYLLGQGLAEHGIDETIQFLIKDETIKINALMYIVKEGKAATVMKDAQEEKVMIHDDLKALIQKRLDTVTRNENTILWIFEDIETGRTSTIIPYVNYEDKKLGLGGYAAFYNNKLVAYLDEDTSLGIDLLKGIVRSCPIYLSAGYGLTIHNVKTVLTPTLQTNGINVNVQLQFDSVLRSISHPNQIVNREIRSQIKQEQTKYMIRLLNQAISVSQTINVDAFRLSDILKNDSTIWTTLKNHQYDFLQITKFDYTIESRVTKSSVLEGWR
ncbi:Ger(x)C family spore germination protein, partial [Anaerosporobacter sp.]|uniref:Ger(x)C family spore germination protein n=1 Tax=Anaerosporobacter sp. TaxID=1872529 RepID=UPI00286F2F66